MSYKLLTSVDKNELAIFSANYISDLICKTLMNKDRVQISLCGGSTPFETYLLLGSKSIPWNRVDLFLGDERWVDTNKSDSNAYLLRDSLIRDGNPANASSFYPVLTTDLQSVNDSAINYSELLKNKLSGNPPSFDLALLGLGDDGHTASLFPGSNSLYVQDDLVTISEGKGHQRITCTYSLLSLSSHVVFLVSGTSKQQALKRLLDSSESTDRTPAKLIQPTSEIVVLTDKDAIG